MFDGNLPPSAHIISEMPALWRNCLAGTRQPDLRGTKILNDCQYIWGTGSVKSRLFMTGSSLALRTKPVPVERHHWPAALANVPGKVLRVDEQVIDPPSLLSCFLQRNQNHILHIDPAHPPQFTLANNRVTSVLIHPNPATRNPQPVPIHPTSLIFTAGQGNAALRQLAGLPDNVMQRRPLHMVMARGNLPRLFGHCVGGPKPRITVTTAGESPQQNVWLIGGQIAEDGVQMDTPQLIRHAKAELLACIPGLDLTNTQFATYRVDRAEALTTTGQKPDDVHIIQNHNLLTAFPTKLALAPRLANRILELLPPPSTVGAAVGAASAAVPPLSTQHSALSTLSPPIAPPPWEAQTPWLTVP
jgi:hypothetical protein